VEPVVGGVDQPVPAARAARIFVGMAHGYSASYLRAIRDHTAVMEIFTGSRRIYRICLTAG